MVKSLLRHLDHIKQHSLFRTIRALIVIISGYSLLLVMSYFDNQGYHKTICLFKNVTGFPCAGCGMGRASVQLMHGKITDAFYYNILSIPFSILVFISAVWLVLDIFRGRDTFFSTINRPTKLKYLIPIFILVAISWVINILRGI